MSYSTTRLTGLSSSMDTDSIIKNLMKIEQSKVDRELRARTKVQWKQEALKTVSADFKSFKEKYMSVLSGDNMLSQATYKAFNVSTNDKNNAVEITANSTAEASKFRIDKIEQLASAATARSTSGVSNGDQLSNTNNIALKDLDLKNALDFDANGNISFTINDRKFTFNQEDTLQHMLTTVSNDEGANVVFSYSRLTDGFSITSKGSGESSSIKYSNLSGNMFGTDSATGIEGVEATGQNAILYVDGQKVEKSTNEFNADGVIFSLKAVTDEAIDCKVTQDTSKAMEKVKTFVNGFNELIDNLQGMLTETKSSSEKGYTPLTEEEKAEMSETQIEQWEAIAKKGLLRNDAALTGVVTQLRNALFSAVEGVGLSPADIGLKTGEWLTGGKIVLDEGKLQTALEENVDKVMDIFTKKSTSTDASKAQSENGLMYRIGDIFDKYTKGTQSITLDAIGRTLTNYDKRITNMESRLADLEERYYLKFASMETSLSNLNSQSSWISQMLGGSQ